MLRLLTLLPSKSTRRRALIGCCTAPAIATTLFSTTAAGESRLAVDAIALPGGALIVPLESSSYSSSFSQDVTDAVTQGFRHRDRNFFEDGFEQFERSLETIQQDQQSTPILTVEPVPDTWQLFFDNSTTKLDDPN